MVSKRFTPETEPDRLAERLNSQFGNEIQDRDSFDNSFNRLLSLEENELSSGQRTLREQTFVQLRNKVPGIDSRRLFQEAGGKDLKRDRLKTAKKVVKSKKVFISRGASRVDLKGFDTLTVTKGRVMFAKRIFVTVRGKQQVRFRDRKGRFTSVKRR